MPEACGGEEFDEGEYENRTQCAFADSQSDSTFRSCWFAAYTSPECIGVCSGSAANTSNTVVFERR